MSFAIDKKTLTSPFIKSLGGADSKHGSDYMLRVKERRNLYLQGLSLGFLLSIIYLITSPFGHRTPTSSACAIAAITMLTAYFYYMLSKKRPLMVLQLDTDEQRKQWANIYRTYQVNYHFGLLLGVLGAATVGYTICPHTGRKTP
jgi:hypothetical protein